MDPESLEDKTLGALHTDIKACENMIRLFTERRNQLQKELSSTVTELSATIEGVAAKRDSSCRKILRRAQ